MGLVLLLYNGPMLVSTIFFFFNDPSLLFLSGSLLVWIYWTYISCFFSKFFNTHDYIAPLPPRVPFPKKTLAHRQKPNGSLVMFGFLQRRSRFESTFPNCYIIKNKNSTDMSLMVH